ncbi:MAG: hopanoid biosynthesis-associated protein HpnK [Candidatus Baltobacteraceae bacterium]
MKRLIVTGDDFGLSMGVNDAIERAHRNGILDTASIMIAAPSAQDAVHRARGLPSLRVGLHVALVQARPMLPIGEVPDLVDESGELATNLTSAGVQFFFNRRVRRQLEAEVRAQFEAFRSTGLRLDHVNAHNHMHVHPTVLSLILQVGKEYGMRAMRVPYEPFLPSWRSARSELRTRLAGAAVLEPWARIMRRRLREAGIAHNDFVFGIHDTGRMTSERVLALLREFPNGVGEIYFHPDDTCAGQEELAALTNPRIVEALRASGIERIGFSDLSPGA